MSDTDYKEATRDTYTFTPSTGADGFIDYTEVEPDKIYLASRKTILDEEYPSYLPPVHIRRNTNYDIPAYKVRDNVYLLRESDELRRDENGKLHNPRIYKVSLDVYAALVNYHLEFDRAAFLAVAKQNEQSRAKALKEGVNEYPAIREKDIPVIPGKFDAFSITNTYTHRYPHIEHKPSRVSLKSTKSGRMGVEAFYFIQDMSKAYDATINRGGIFRMHRECLDDVNQKILDMELQKADWESTWTKGRETSYGDTNLDDSLLQSYGIRVKRQNGENISQKEIEELKTALNRVHSVFGNISDVSQAWGLKVSHAGNTKMHASKYVGLFTPYYRAIGISFAGGEAEASLTAIHEYAHFMDHLSGKELNAWHASDIPGTLENQIAVEFRGQMIDVKGDYWSRTCECFARAIEEYAQITFIREQEVVDNFSLDSINKIDAKIAKPGSVKYLPFKETIEPLVNGLLEQYRERYTSKQREMRKEEPMLENTASIAIPAISHEATIEELQKEVYTLAVEKNRLDKEARSITEKINEERKNLFEEELKRISAEIGAIDRKLLLHSESGGNGELVSDLERQKKELAERYNAVRYEFTPESEELTAYREKDTQINSRLQEIDKEGRRLTLKLMELEKKEEERKKDKREHSLLPGTFTQLELFEKAAEYSALERETTGYVTEIVEGDPTVTREHIREAKAAQRSYTSGILKGTKSGLWKVFRDFKEHGIFDIRGAQVATNQNGHITREGWEQLHQALNIYRDKRFETFRVLFVTQEGIIRDQVAISSRLPNKVLLSSLNSELGQQVIDYAINTNTKIVLVHNHPSGNVAPSIEDESITKHVESTMVNTDGRSLVVGHIILDHDSFGLYQSNIWDTIRVNTQEKDPLLKRRLPEFTQEQINSPIVLKKIAIQINENDRWNSTDWVPILFTDSASRVSGIRYYSRDWLINTPSENVIQEFRTVGQKSGSTWAFAIVSDEIEEKAEIEHAIIEHMKNGCFMDFCIAGKTADLYFLDQYRSGFYETLSRDDVLERTTVESTFKIEKQDGSVQKEYEEVASASQTNNYDQSNKFDKLFRTHNSPDLPEALDSISRLDIGKPNAYITISDKTPFIYVELGLPESPVTMYRDKIARALFLEPYRYGDRWSHGHSDGLEKKTVERVFEQLADPFYVFKSKDGQSLVSVFDVLDKNGEPVIVAFNYNTDRNGVEANWVKSLYGKNEYGIEHWAKEGLLYYVNDKEKATELSITLQMRVMGSSAAYNQNIKRKTELVNNYFLNSPAQEYDLFSASELETVPIQHRPVENGEKLVIQGEEYTVQIRKSGIVSLINTDGDVSLGITASLSDLPSPASIIKSFEKSLNEGNIFDNTIQGESMSVDKANNRNESIQFSFKTVNLDVMFKINDSDWQVLGTAESELEAQQYILKLEEDERSGTKRNIQAMTSQNEQYIFSKFYASREAENYLVTNPVGETEKEQIAEIEQELNMNTDINNLPFEERTFAAQKTTGTPTTVEHTVRAILDFSTGSAAQFINTDQVEEIQKFQLETAQWAYDHDRIGSPFNLFAEYAEVLQAKQAEIDAQQDIFYQDDIKVYKTRIREENGNLKEMWAVQDERNIGTDRKAYDLLFDTRERAIDGARREKKERISKAEQKIEEERNEKTRIEQEEKRKEKNRELSITERKANAYLEKNLPRAIYDGRTAEQHMELEGTYLEKVETDHRASYNRIKYNRMDYQEQQKYEKKLREPKTEYRMYTATPGQFFEIGATLYNYLSEKYPNKIGQKEESQIDKEVFSFKAENRNVLMKIDDAEWHIIGTFSSESKAKDVVTMLQEDEKTNRTRELSLYDDDTSWALEAYYNERAYSKLLNGNTSKDYKNFEMNLFDTEEANENQTPEKIVTFEKGKLYRHEQGWEGIYIGHEIQDIATNGKHRLENVPGFEITKKLSTDLSHFSNNTNVIWGDFSTQEFSVIENNLTETLHGSYNNIEEILPRQEEHYDNSNRPTSQNERESDPFTSVRSVSESEELRRDDLLQTSGYAGIRAGSDLRQSTGREDVPGAGHIAVNGELPESFVLDDRDGGGGVRTGSLPETERTRDRGQSEVNAGASRNGYISPKTARDIRAECISILTSKSDHEITDADRAILAQYEGAGGLGEKTASAAGVLSEFYTPENVISSVWKLVDAYHPSAQTVMEPSAGTGRFAQGRNEQFTLHELDDTSSRIARILHPDATVISGAFQKQFFDPSGRILKKGYIPPTYDVVIGNPPYGTYSGTWKGLGEGKHHARYEEYFIEKGLDSLKEDGILAYVVPSGFLRSGRDSVKELLATKGTLIDAWRLPNGAFPTTDVGTDIIVMRKGVSDPELISNDRYFIDHPEHILGEYAVRQGRFGQEQFVAIPEEETIDTLLQKIQPEQLIFTDKTIEQQAEPRHVERESIVKTTTGIEPPVLAKQDTLPKLSKVLSAEEMKNHPDVPSDLKSKILSSKEFNSVYGKEHDEREQPIWAATAWNGFIDLNKLDVDTRQYLEQSDAYVEISPGKWMHKIVYASGNVYEKLDALEDEFKGGLLSEELYTKNKKILEQAAPEKVPLQEIHFSPMTTLAEEFTVTAGSGKELILKEGFVNWVTGYAEENSQTYYGRRNFDPALSPLSKEDLPPNVGWWDIIEYLDGEPVRARRGWSEEHKKAQQIEAEQKRVARRDTADKLFDRYIHEGLDENTAKRLENEWNRRFNCNVNPDYAKLPLYVEGMSVYKGDEPFTLYDQQIKGISFLSNKGNGLLAYDVGVGKTAAGIVSTVNQIQTGRATRPLIIVPKSVYSKWNRDIQQLFPNIPVNDLGNFSDKNLAPFRTDDYGLKIPENSISVCTIEALQRISFTDESIAGPLFDDFSNLLGGIDDDGSDRAQKQQAEKIAESVGRASQTKEGFVFWENTGFDHVTVDEAHRFKNLYKTPRSGEKGKANEYAGLGAGNPSARALKLFGITQLVQRENDNRNVFLLTATPFTNSPLEVYSMMSYMGRERLKEMHLYNLKSFMDEFAEMKNEWAVDAKGSIQTRQVMKNFRSLPALQNLLLEYIDKVDGEEAGVIRPRKFTHVEKLETTELQKKIIEAETARMLDKDALKNGGVLVAMNNMRMAMLSPALLQDAGYEFEIPPLSQMVDCSPKLKLVCDTIVDCWKREPSGGQIMYMPRGVEESKYVKDYLVNKGIPENVIGFINSSVSDAKKDVLTEAFNDKTNQLKIIIGSETISEGVDLNGNSFVCYNTMLGWNPTETIQVEGRAWRQGNEQGHVHMVYPLMNDSIDALMYQKFDEKSSRINALWSYKGDRLNVEDINPEELKFDLVKDPAKKADFILSEKTLDLRTEEVLVKGKLETIDTILQKQKTFQLELESSNEGVSRWIERKKEDYGRDAHFYDRMIEREKEKKVAAERNLPSINKKLEGMGLDTQDKIDIYIRSLNERKNEIAEEIKKIHEAKDEIIAELTAEEEKKKAVLPTFADSQRSLVEKIVGNLRPMSEVETEIRAARGEQNRQRNIQSYNSQAVEEKSGEHQNEGNTVIDREITDKQNEITPALDKETGQFLFFDDELLADTGAEVAESSAVWEKELTQIERESAELERNIEKQVLDSMSDTENEYLKALREDFYRTIQVDPKEKNLYPDISLSEILIPIQHEGTTRSISADIILHSAFVSDIESSTGVPPTTIHGIDEYLNPSNFSLTYFGMPKTLDEVTRAREQYVQENLARVKVITEPEIQPMASSQKEVAQKKAEYIIGNIYAGNDEKLGKWRGIYAGEGQFELTRAAETGLFKEGDVIMPESNEKVEFVGRKAGYKPPQVSKEQETKEVNIEDNGKEANTLEAFVLTNVEDRHKFYTTIGIDPAEPLFAGGKSLQDITSFMAGPQEYDESGLVYQKQYVLSADDVLYAAFVSDKDHEQGKPLSSIHGIDSFLTKEHFNLNGTYEGHHLFYKALAEREIFFETQKGLINHQQIKDKENVEVPRKSYNQINTERLLDSLKTRSAPFLGEPDEKSKINLTPQVIRSGVTGRAFKGMNQILAQIMIKEIGTKEYELITYEQAKRHGAGIKKGSPGINLTTFDVATQHQNVYRYYPISAVYHREKLPKVPEHKINTSMVVECEESVPEKFLGHYLAATSLGARFETTKSTMIAFKKSFEEELKQACEEKKFTKIFEIGNRASTICQNTMREIGEKARESERIRQKAFEIKSRYEPYNPVTGEKFVGLSAKKANYVMESRQSQDPRFLELTDILKAGLSLKDTVKEPLIISNNGKSRFFYNAKDIEGIPPMKIKTISLAQQHKNIDKELQL